MSPRGHFYYEDIKARIIAGHITAAEGKAAMILYHEQAQNNAIV